MAKSYGGQALIEGVMMRGQAWQSKAVRLESGQIVHETEAFTTWGDRYPVLKVPFIRGTVALFESLYVGMKSVTWSTNMSLAEDEEEEELTFMEILLTIGLAFVLGLGLFFLLPVLLSHFLLPLVPGTFAQNLLEGLFRVGIFFLYLYGISHMKEIRRVFQYHGAEHKTIHCYESGDDLRPDVVAGYSRLHPRCGTSFLFLVMAISILVYSFVGVDHMGLRMASRIFLLPVVAGLSYEVLRWTGCHMDRPLVRAIAWPGMQLQKLTTAEPDPAMIEVAIFALQKVRTHEEQGVADPELSPSLGQSGLPSTL